MAAETPPRTQTIADVAALAGVSLATVSRVMNGNASVDQALAARVRAAAEQLNYSASPLARSLVLGKTNTIAVVVPDLENPTFHGVLRGLSRAAARDGYHVLIADSAESVAAERTLAVETRKRCDGLVLCAPRMADKDLKPLLEELRPVVLVNRDAGSPSTPVVAADYQTALSDLLALLYGHGHRSLVYLSGAPQSASSARRMAALRDFLDDRRRRRPDHPVRGRLRRGPREHRRGARVGGDRGAGLQRPGRSGPTERPGRAGRPGARPDSRWWASTTSRSPATSRRR